MYVKNIDINFVVAKWKSVLFSTARLMSFLYNYIEKVGFSSSNTY